MNHPNRCTIELGGRLSTPVFHPQTPMPCFLQNDFPYFRGTFELTNNTDALWLFNLSTLILLIRLNVSR